MKPPSVIALQRLKAARRWIFRWRGLDGTPFRGILAMLITTGLSALFAATLRIRINAPQQWIERKASIMHLPSDGDGALWALRAKEGGPFPSRLDPREWEGMTGLGDVVAAATRWTSPPYQPSLRELPADSGVATPGAAAKGERVFPKRASKTAPPADPAETKLVPSIYPLSGIAAGSLPAELPPFTAPLDPAMTSAAWRFLIRLRPDGGVAECVPMIEESGRAALVEWLRGINFGAETAKKSPWIGIGIGFIQQTATRHGPEPR